MGLFDTDDIWDPSCLFPYEEEESKEDQKCSVDRENDDNDNDGEQEKSNNKPSEDLALVFLEWLKSNKETISAEDLRSIKLKRSTIECAAKRLGGGKEGMKQLLKLILEWVQNNHLQKKRLKEGQASSFPSYGSQQQHQNLNPNSHEFSSFTPPESNPACFVPTANQWNLSPHPPPPVVPQSTYVPDPMATGHAVYPPPPPPPPPPPQPMHGFVNGDPSMFVPHFNQNPYPSSADYMFDASSSHHQTWSHHQQPPPHHFSLSSHPYGASYHHQDPHAHHLQPPPPLSRSFSTYHQNQYQPCHQMFQGSNTTTTTTSTTSSDGSLIRLGSSATKEARKKRMARQRKIFSHHQRHAQNNHQTNTTELQQTRVLNDTTATHHQALNNPANWVYWSPSPQPQPQPPTTVCGSMSPMMMVSDGPPLPADPLPQPTQSPNYHKQINMETRRDGCKPTEKNLKFLLQKVLEQSDVGNLGRIVLPKKEAETYLPELEARDGISIAMEDIGTSRIWNMRYRFWPNNKSRMYLLENTGDFVRSNGLQEGDFIVIYSDIKCGKFMIRGVKVRQPGSKSEAKKSAKAHRNLHANSPMCEGPSTSMIKQAVA
ncbi:hypothetical protein MKW94_012063 [Papaver nudicaule]|uniref:TF-B3 domain-containing protein n=1 Tax=Papaver nudicaule TaxID=74823 RepID=A0AA41VWP8_PAPNU|nr:hypothetical protein [Papaver nudicaule]